MDRYYVNFIFSCIGIHLNSYAYDDWNSDDDTIHHYGWRQFGCALIIAIIIVKNCLVGTLQTMNQMFGLDGQP